MVAENREFWARVALETDNDHEWLPNDNQQSALGIELPPGTGAAWMIVLADFEAVMNGEKLVPYWRVGAPAGMNVGKIFTDPRPDRRRWLDPGLGRTALSGTGHAGLPRQRRTPSISLTSGQAMLFALYLN